MRMCRVVYSDDLRNDWEDPHRPDFILFAQFYLTEE